MPNHVHLLAEMLDDPISRVMHGLLTAYSQYHNRKYRKIGHLFQGRYKAIICQSEKGDHGRAESLYREALAMQRKLLGNEHAGVAESLDNLAMVLEARGNYQEAEPLYRQSLAMRRRVLGNESCRTTP